jgi:hypothetical protein
MDCVLVSSAVDHVYYIIKNNISDVMDCVLVSSAVDHVYYIIKNNNSDVMDCVLVSSDTWSTALDTRTQSITSLLLFLIM